jgi:hypothetical protein
VCEETHALAHLTGQVKQAAWAAKFKADDEYLYPCFLLAFGCLARQAKRWHLGQQFRGLEQSEASVGEVRLCCSGFAAQ